jgi:hypothetical protein
MNSASMLTSNFGGPVSFHSPIVPSPLLIDCRSLSLSMFCLFEVLDFLVPSFSLVMRPMHPIPLLSQASIARRKNPHVKNVKSRILSIVEYICEASKRD